MHAQALAGQVGQLTGVERMPLKTYENCPFEQKKLMFECY